MESKDPIPKQSQENSEISPSHELDKRENKQNKGRDFITREKRRQQSIVRKF